MASVREMSEVLAEVLGEPLPTVRLVTRALLDDGLLPRSQGKRIAQVTGRDIATLILGLYGAPVVREAAAAVRRYGDMTLDGIEAPASAPQKLKAAIAHEPKALEALGDLIDAGGPQFVEIVQSWPEITITLAGDGEEVSGRYVLPGCDPTRWQSTRPRRSVVIPHICFSLILDRLSAATGEG